MKLVNIPPTIEDAISELDALGTLLTAKEWHRAAVVWAFTRDLKGRPKSDGNPSLSIAAFAKLGITGLKNRETVAAYRKVWQDAIDSSHAPAVEPGCKRVMLPTIPWPRIDWKADSRPAERVARAAREIVKDPRLAGKFREEIAKEQDKRRAPLYKAVEPLIEALDGLGQGKLTVLESTIDRLQDAVEYMEMHQREYSTEDWAAIRPWMDRLYTLNMEAGLR